MRIWAVWKDFLRLDTIIIKAWADGYLVRYVIRYAAVTVYGSFPWSCLGALKSPMKMAVVILWGLLLGADSGHVRPKGFLCLFHGFKARHCHKVTFSLFIGLYLRKWWRTWAKYCRSPNDCIHLPHSGQSERLTFSCCFYFSLNVSVVNNSVVVAPF